MKRSLCLPALVVGLWSTITSSTLAAPPAVTDQASARRVAQADPAPPQPSDSPPSGSPVTSDASGQGAQPAVSAGVSTAAPATDTPATSAPEPTRAPAPRPFAGSSLFVTNSMTTSTVFRGQQQYSDPTVEGSLWLLPRYAFNDAFQLRARAVVSYEYTNSDTTLYRNEPTLSDTSLQLFYRKIPKLPGGFLPSVALNVSLPTSKASRAKTLLFSPGATVQLARPFEKVLGGDGMVLGSLSYSHPIYESRNPEVVDPRPPGAFQCMGGNNCQDLLSGTMNTSDALSYSLLLEMEWGRWNPAIYYMGASQWAYTPKEAINPVDGTPVGRPPGFEPTNVRQMHYFSVWLDYNFNTWLTGEIGFWNSTNAINGAGQRANVIFNRYDDTRVYLGASIQLDNLVKALQGGNAGEAGVVRAKNNKQPMWTF